jgi:hypothetical protein
MPDLGDLDAVLLVQLVVPAGDAFNEAADAGAAAAASALAATDTVAPGCSAITAIVRPTGTTSPSRAKMQATDDCLVSAVALRNGFQISITAKECFRLHILLQPLTSQSGTLGIFVASPKI